MLRLGGKGVEPCASAAASSVAISREAGGGQGRRRGGDTVAKGGRGGVGKAGVGVGVRQRREDGGNELVLFFLASRRFVSARDFFEFFSLV